VCTLIILTEHPRSLLYFIMTACVITIGHTRPLLYFYYDYQRVYNHSTRHTRRLIMIEHTRSLIHFV